MSKNPPGLITLTPDQLREHDRRLVARTNQFTVGYMIDDMIKKNPGQALRAARANGKDYLLSEDKIDWLLDKFADLDGKDDD